MNYIVAQRFKTNAICGEVNIPYGETCQEIDGFIYYQGNRLCSKSSQNAYKYLSRNDDFRGIERFKKIKNIMKILNKRDNHYQDRWDRIREDESLQRFKKENLGKDWQWNFEFYNASIEDLDYIYNLIKQ